MTVPNLTQGQKSILDLSRNCFIQPYFTSNQTFVYVDLSSKTVLYETKYQFPLYGIQLFKYLVKRCQGQKF